MFTLKSTQFNLEGFIMVLLASFIGGIRWTLTQLLIQKAELGEPDSKRLLDESVEGGNAPKKLI